MTDPMTTSDDRRDNDAQLPDRRPIPDGGLGSAMPEWMRKTPSWKRQAEPAATRTIPEADTSVIDPRQLIDLDDLPKWLQDVAARGAMSIELPTPDPTGQQVYEADSPTMVTIEEEIGIDPPPSVADRPRTGPGTWLPIPGPEAPVERPDHVRLTPSPLHAEPPWWMSDAVIAFLFVAIILTLVYVIIAAAGVV